MMRDPRATAIATILAMLEDQSDHDPRLDIVVEVGLRELFGFADRMAQAAERQAEALERIHARLGFGLVDEPRPALGLLVEQLANIAGALTGKPACPECGAMLAKRPGAHIEGAQ
jgi:hypothetical protein